ncbi:MAG: hypothetical protein WDA16_03255 [Candidatus Thermoplasmatota archaeon]
MSRVPIAILIALTLLATVSSAIADDGAKEKGDSKDKHEQTDAEDNHGKAEFERRGSKWILHNDKLAVWFHQGDGGKAKPDVRVALNGTDDEKSGYRVEILRLCEVGPNATECGGGLPRVNLARANDWNVVTEQTNTTLTLTMVHADAQAIVTIVWHIDTQAATVKYDVNVQNWRWSDTTDRLLLDTHIVGKNLRNATGSEITIEDAGYIQWATTSTATFGPNDTRTLPVEASLKHDDAKEKENEHGSDDSEHEKAERDSGKGGHLILVFNGTGGAKTVSYDPTLGISSVSSTGVSLVPATGLLAGVAVIGTAALIMRRRG